MAEM
ncbi:hypothetical protein MMN70_08570 [Escherichia coli]|jgi:hypothetical protein